MAQVHSSRDAKEEEKIYFHPKQIEYLEKLFPERVILSTAPEAELREYMGTRKVVHALRGRVRAE